MFKKVFSSFIAITLLVSTAFSLQASAEESINNDNNLTYEQQQEVDKLAIEVEKDLRFYFEEIGELTESGYKITNPALLQEKISANDQTAINIAEIIGYSEYNKYDKEIQRSAASFGKCIANKFINSYGNIARQFLSGAIFTYIKSKQYDLAAKLIANTLIRAGFKVNAAGIAVEAAAYGWQCRNEW
ncbi:hypothetical protein [Bacillus cereus]|uniref:Uncharacterized protein n=1 Tax=Bacillus cereus (strain ZK / E33L) TaxID=288681 RepID=Q630E5_BACCZ|nr:hypothetical protein [Bacillus cereus]AAU20284.1 hypothetical protein BCE33L5154 [Bacillus cereus E33L]AJI31636.1 hypothetical protein BF28_227 [Bacillus cereus E33L]MCU4788283.1 hypothetical protein [Bacillus cereus]MCU5552393.1 hypothetical protein [Bacillus cereus]